ncbi:hypothetical protein CHS0354_041357 [Potamilus streckersoni]|uniref:Uncharacterized protein n=1 Tax=Potamilus streckersoni TaxID=2493646 RepID=A0AAE0W9I9_9BIVA|nr:hypothetical protein CHS0354_041357 [Potamilus streckersoni]
MHFKAFLLIRQESVAPLETTERANTFRMKTAYYSVTVIVLSYLIILTSTVPRVRGQIIPSFYAPPGNVNGIGALLLGILLFGTLFLLPPQNLRGGNKLNVTNEENAANRADAQSESEGISDTSTYIYVP